MLAGAGSFHCADCGYAVALHERDELPPCPSCAGTAFARLSMFGVTQESPAPDAATAAMPQWVTDARAALIRAGDYFAYDSDAGRRVVPLAHGWTRIGRSLSAHVRLDDPTVSRRHALVHRDGNAAKLFDDRSLNGVFHNARHVETTDLADCDRISVGRFTLYFVRLGADGTR